MFEGFQTPLSATTRCCAILGHPVRHSASPAMHNAAFASLGLNLRYLAFEVPPADLRAALNGARAMGILGLNLTVPHKLLALKMVEVLDETAKQWGAVNTIRFEGRETRRAWQPLHHFTDTMPAEIRAHGFNTDADGLAQSLREDLQLKPAGAKILLLGAGGAGRVAALKLAAEGAAELFLVNRTKSRAKALAAEIHRRYPKVKVIVSYPKVAVDLLLNATSLGLKAGDASPLEEAQFPLKRAGAVYDMIYQPAETALLKAAKAAGCRTANGLGMLVHQGARAFEIWTGRPAPVAVMRKAATKSIYGS